MSILLSVDLVDLVDSKFLFDSALVLKMVDLVGFSKIFITFQMQKDWYTSDSEQSEFVLDQEVKARNNTIKCLSGHQRKLV